MQFGFSLYGAWWFSIIYLIFAFGLWFIFPKYVQIRFNKLPKVGSINKFYHYCFILLIISTIVIPFKYSSFFFIGSFLYVLGLSIFISAIYQFAITDIRKPVTGGVYKWSRHPIYLGFSVMWFGVSLATLNVLVFLLILLISYFSFRIGLAEEKACFKTYGSSYSDYKKKVYLILGRRK